MSLPVACEPGDSNDANCIFSTRRDHAGCLDGPSTPCSGLAAPPRVVCSLVWVASVAHRPKRAHIDTTLVSVFCSSSNPNSKPQLQLGKICLDVLSRSGYAIYALSLKHSQQTRGYCSGCCSLEGIQCLRVLLKKTIEINGTIRCFVLFSQRDTLVGCAERRYQHVITLRTRVVRLH